MAYPGNIKKKLSDKSWIHMTWEEHNEWIYAFENAILNAFGNFPKKNWS